MATERRPPPAERLRRIWQITEEIAHHPGQQRRDLAATFHVSERQMQADLGVITRDLSLPLIRWRGYRFAGEGPSPEGGLTLQDAQVLLMVLTAARRDPSIARDALDALNTKLPAVFPSHVQPIVRSVLRVLDRRSQSDEQRVLVALLHAILRGLWVQLDQMPSGEKPIIRPDVLLPFRGHWYVLGERFKTAQNAGYCLTTVHDVATVTVEHTMVRTIRIEAAS